MEKWWPRVMRFSATGLIATLLHVTTATLLIELRHTSPPVANGLAFTLATSFSYFLNTRWTFNKQLSKQTFGRFCLVSGTGFSVSIAVSNLAVALGLPYQVGIAGVVLLVPVMNFLLHQSWTYR